MRRSAALSRVRRLLPVLVGLLGFALMIKMDDPPERAAADRTGPPTGPPTDSAPGRGVEAALRRRVRRWFVRMPCLPR